MSSGDKIDHRPLPVVVQRWRRYGHDRAYVQIDGLQVGYRDLKTGKVHCEQPTHTEVVARASASLLTAVPDSTPAAPAGLAAVQDEYSPRHAGPHAVVAVYPTSAASAVRTMPLARNELLPDRDLARNQPGSAARRQAVTLRDAAPVRTFVARIVGAKTDERNWRIGADAEVEVARRLSRLGPQWRVLHAIPVGEQGSDIDHLVIGPAGVFTINAKHHPDASIWVHHDTVKVNGHHHPYVRNSRHEARRAAKLLTAHAGFDVEVRALIAIMGARGGFTVRRQPSDGTVTVVTRKTIEEHLQALPHTLGLPSIERIYDVARHLATWQPNTVAWASI
ncbi:MAG: nuclease-related domain-containing protein [Jatrophihabitantaceae bacterium]